METKTSRKNIVIVLYQYSVVVKGIERKLNEMGYQVEILTEEFDQISAMAKDTDLFLLYLPGDIMDAPLRTRALFRICDTIRDCQSRMLILGEKKFHSDLEQAVPDIDRYGWLDRPVDADVLKSAVEKAIAETPEAGAKKRILIVDDDPSYAGMVRAWIKDDFHVGVVTNGMQSISYAMRNPLDLILLDYEMPGMDGPKVFQMLRQEEATKHIPVVFLTGIGTKESVARVMGLRPEGYILKSTTRENLLSFIHKTIG